MYGMGGRDSSVGRSVDRSVDRGAREGDSIDSIGSRSSVDGAMASASSRASASGRGVGGRRRGREGAVARPRMGARAVTTVGDGDGGARVGVEARKTVRTRSSAIVRASSSSSSSSREASGRVGGGDVVDAAGVPAERDEEEEDAVVVTRMEINASPESVWTCLSNGENLSEFVPTLLVSRRGPKQYASAETEVRMLAMDYTLFTPRMLNTVSVRIVDKSKGPPNWENGPGKIGFLARNVDERSEFTLVGSFAILPIFGESYKCRVEYRAELRPNRYKVPVKVLQRAVDESIPFISASITRQAVKRDQRRLRSPGFLPQLETPFGARSIDLDDKKDPLALKSSEYLGLSEVKVPIPSADSSQDEDAAANGVHMRPRGEQNGAKASEAPKSWQAIGGSRQSGKWFSSDITPFENSGALEVHMRRYDTESLLHRRALAAVRIEAPPALVWELLTNYDNMPKFVPHLMHTEYIQRYNADAMSRAESENIKRLRLRHVFLKCELFHCVEESTAMDVVQKDDRYEIQFRILQNPKFGALQGKWLVAASDDSRASVLKFAIEGVVQNIRRDASNTVDPLNERIVFEEISSMLEESRDFLESVANKEVESFTGIDVKVADIAMKGSSMSLDEEDVIEDMSDAYLEADQKLRTKVQKRKLLELKETLLGLGFGEDKTMPTRQQLRDGNHWDAVQQIENLGGFVKVGNMLHWTGSKSRPRGYWSLTTLELEIKNFIVNSEDPDVRRNPDCMPSQKALSAGGRMDIVNALKRFGGAQKVAKSIGMRFVQKRTTKAKGKNKVDNE